MLNKQNLIIVKDLWSVLLFLIFSSIYLKFIVESKECKDLVRNMKNSLLSPKGFFNDTSPVLEVCEALVTTSYKNKRNIKVTSEDGTERIIFQEDTNTILCNVCEIKSELWYVLMMRIAIFTSLFVLLYLLPLLFGIRILYQINLLYFSYCLFQIYCLKSIGILFIIFLGIFFSFLFFLNGWISAAYLKIYYFTAVKKGITYFLIFLPILLCSFSFLAFQIFMIFMIKQPSFFNYILIKVFLVMYLLLSLPIIIYINTFFLINLLYFRSLNDDYLSFISDLTTSLHNTFVCIGSIVKLGVLHYFNRYYEIFYLVMRMEITYREILDSIVFYTLNFIHIIIYPFSIFVKNNSLYYISCMAMNLHDYKTNKKTTRALLRNKRYIMYFGLNPSYSFNLYSFTCFYITGAVSILEHFYVKYLNLNSVLSVYPVIFAISLIAGLIIILFNFISHLIYCSAIFMYVYNRNLFKKEYRNLFKIMEHNEEVLNSQNLMFADNVF